LNYYKEVIVAIPEKHYKMNDVNSFTKLSHVLISLGYHETSIQGILDELDVLLRDFERIKQAAGSALEARDTPGLINSLKDLMLLLENQGYYRPDAPTRLIRLLVNGLALSNEDIFFLLDKASIPEKDKKEEQELLASCAAITQLGYILLSEIVPEVKAASSGPHVFLVIDSFSPGTKIFVDFSIESIKEIDARRFEQKESYYHLKITEGLDNETIELLKKYYLFFNLTSGIGLSHNIHNNLALAYDRIGRYDEAIEELKVALRLNPYYIEAHNNLAVAYYKMGMHYEAEKKLQEALRLNPEYAEAHNNLGNIYGSMGKYEEGIEELQKALRINPDYAVAHNNLGNIYTHQKRNQDALKEFQAALNLTPDYAPAHNNLGNFYSESGMHEQALKEFQEALRLNPEFPEAYFGLGSVYFCLGSYERAAQALIRAVYLDRELLECVPQKLLLKVRQGVSRLR